MKRKALQAHSRHVVTVLQAVASAGISAEDAEKLYLGRRRIQKAAYLRVRGGIWPEIAPLIGCKSARSAQRSVKRDPEKWAAALREATDEVLAEEVEPEAIRAQRQLMGLKDEPDLKAKDVAVRATDSMLRYLAKVRPMRMEVELSRGKSEDAELIERLRDSANQAAQAAAAEAQVVPPVALLSEPKEEEKDAVA